MLTHPHLLKAILAFNHTLNPKDTFKAVVQETATCLGADFGSIYLVTPQGSLRRAFTNIPVKNRIRSRKKGNTYKAVSEQKIIILSQKNLTKIHPEAEEKNIKTIVLLPLVYEKESIGVLTLLSKKQLEADSETISEVSLLAQVASQAIVHAQNFEEAQNAISQRDTMISMASHELKTPLTSISGFTQLSLDRLYKQKPVREKHLHRIHEQAQKLEQTINDFLNVDILKAGRLNYELDEVSLIDVLDSVISGFKVHFPKHKLKTNFDFESTDIWVMGDFFKLSQAINNIVLNAGKYSSEGSNVWINLEQEEQLVILEISDEGHGISTAEKDKVFDLFYRSQDTDAIGHGIGLFLAKKIIENHHGTIELSSTSSKGTTFSITLPII